MSASFIFLCTMLHYSLSHHMTNDNLHKRISENRNIKFSLTLVLFLENSNYSIRFDVAWRTNFIELWAFICLYRSENLEFVTCAQTNMLIGWGFQKNFSSKGIDPSLTMVFLGFLGCGENLYELETWGEKCNQ